MATVSTTTIPPNLNLAHLAFIGFPGLNQWRPHLRSERLRSAIAPTLWCRCFKTPFASELVAVKKFNRVFRVSE